MAHDPEHIFKVAELFRRASNSLMFNSAPEMILPSAICGAFAAELYLKCLILIETSATLRVHDLKKLFDRLPSKSQDSIRADFDTRTKHLPALYESIFRQTGARIPFKDFDAALNAGRQIFELLRYAYELERPTQPLGWTGDLVEAIRQRVIELMPAWGQ